MSEDVLTAEDLLTAIRHMERFQHRSPEAVEMSPDVFTDMRLRHAVESFARPELHDRIFGLPIRVVTGRNVLRPVYGITLVPSNPSGTHSPAERA